MKTILVTTLFAAIVVKSATSAEFHVAPTGSDANPGTADKPFVTLEKARDAARGEKGSTVHISGTIRLTKTFELNEKDSGTRFVGQKARIVGSVAIPNSAAKPVTNKAILDRLLPEVRGKVLEIDLRALGITDFGDIGPRGFRRPYVPAPLELFVNDEPLRIAQWPNPDQPAIPVGKVLDKGSVTRDGEKPTRGGIFEFNTDRPNRWSGANDLWLTGIFNKGWADNTVKVKAMDLKKRTLSTGHPDMYGFASGAAFRSWRAWNLLEEIDLPGEFMADKETGKLYFLPPADGSASPSALPTPGGSTTPESSTRLEVAVMKTPLIAIEGATHIVFDGINIENSRGMGVYIERGANNRIQNCTLRNLGLVAVCVGKGISPDPDYRHAFTGTPISRDLGSWHEHIYDNPAFDRDAGTGHGVVNCKIYNIGAGAISLGGGDRVTLTPAGNFVENCEIFRFNRWDRTYKGAINIEGVGNRIAHCDIHDGPALAIYLHGNDHIIEYNRIHRVCMEGDDMGAFYMGRDPTERGSVIRYNYWHDIGTAHMIFCLYFDDFTGDGNTVYGNIFRNAGTAATVFVNASREMTITNNLFIDCPVNALVINQLSVSLWNQERFDLTKSRMNAVNYRQPPWSDRHPTLLQYDFSPSALGKSVVSEKNLFLNCTKSATRKFKTHPLIERANRTINDPSASAKLFVDPAKGNFTLKPGADIGIPGFEPVPFDKIGLKK